MGESLKSQYVLVAICVLMGMLTGISANITPNSPVDMTMVELKLSDNNLDSCYSSSFNQFDDLEELCDCQGFAEYCNIRVKINDKALDVPETRLSVFSSLPHSFEAEERSSCTLEKNCTLYSTAWDPQGYFSDKTTTTQLYCWGDHAQLWSQFGCKVQRSDCGSCNAVCCIISSPLFD